MNSLPTISKSSLALGDVVQGPDAAAAFISASRSGDLTALDTILSQPSELDMILSKPRRIDYESCKISDTSSTREVSARPIMNLEWALWKSAEKGEAAVVTKLFTFAKQHGIRSFDLIDGARSTVERVISRGDIATFNAFVAADARVVSHKLLHTNAPLDLAVRKSRTELVKIILERGASTEPIPYLPKRSGGYSVSLLSEAAEARGDAALPITEMLLNHGVKPALSGALHRAAELGVLDVIPLLIKCGAGIDEQLPVTHISTYGDKTLWASWTPMHFAASKGQVQAMRLLEESGARTEVQDRDGNTPKQLLDAFNAEGE